MKCPNCKFETKHAVCPECGVNIALMDKTQSLSNSLYNKGLAEAKSNDLTNALITLQKSVEFDKSNTQARNLLGLVYFGCGKIGDAIKEWVISTNFDTEHNAAKDYLLRFQKNPREMERLNDSIKMHNQAIDYLKQGSEDIAIIQLKKAIDINPNFVSAYNLLTFCYMKIKDRHKAVSAVEKTLELDISNPTALRYARELNVSRAKTDLRDKNIYSSEKRKKELSYMNNMSSNRKTASPAFAILGLVIGIAVAAVFFYLIILPPQITRYDHEIALLSSEKDSAYSALKNDLDSLQDLYDALAEKNNTNEETIATQAEKLELYERMSKMDSANNLFVQKMYLEAVTLLDTISVDGLPLEYKEMYQNIKNTSYPIIEKNYFDTGYSLYVQRNYAEAKTNLLESLKFVTPSSRPDGAYYYLGRIFEIDQDYASARQYYELLINNYPNSSQFNNAAFRLRNLPQQ